MAVTSPTLPTRPAATRSTSRRFRNTAASGRSRPQGGGTPSGGATGFTPRDKHKNNPYDFLCTAAGADLYVEVKGTQDDGRAISLTPREVQHVLRHKNSALFILHSVVVKGKRNPQVSGGMDLFVEQWDISAGKLEPRGYIFHLPASTFALKKGMRSKVKP